MAIDTPLLWRRRILAAVAETTTGTANTAGLTAASAAMNVMSHEMDLDSPSNERPGQSALSPLFSISGEMAGHYNFAVELANDGTSNPLWASTLLPACGMVSASGVYTPQTGASTTLTMGLFNDGRLKQIAGAQGTWTIKCAVGKIPYIEFKFSGKWADPSSVALITPTYPTANPPKFTGANFTIAASGGAATQYRIDELEIEWGATVTLRKDANDPTGYHAACVTARKPVVKFAPEALPLGTQDWYAFRKGDGYGTLSCVIGSGAGKQVTVAAPKMALASIKDKDRSGTLADELVWNCARNSAAGDDELSIAFS